MHFLHMTPKGYWTLLGWPARATMIRRIPVTQAIGAVKMA